MLLAALLISSSLHAAAPCPNGPGNCPAPPPCVAHVREVNLRDDVPGLLAAAGAAYAFSAASLTPCIGEQCDPAHAWLAVPVAGPWVAIARSNQWGPRAGYWTAAVLQSLPLAEALAFSFAPTTRTVHGCPERPERALHPAAIVGVALFGTVYLPALFLGLGCGWDAQCPGVGWLAVPFAGPFLAAPYAHNAGDLAGRISVGALELGAVALAVGGLRSHPVAVGPLRARVALLPTAIGATAGLTLAVTHF